MPSDHLGPSRVLLTSLQSKIQAWWFNFDGGTHYRGVKMTTEGQLKKILAQRRRLWRDGNIAELTQRTVLLGMHSPLVLAQVVEAEQPYYNKILNNIDGYICSSDRWR